MATPQNLHGEVCRCPRTPFVQVRFTHQRVIAAAKDMDRARQFGCVLFLVCHTQPQIVSSGRDGSLVQSGPARQPRRQAAQIGQQRRESLVVEEVYNMQWQRQMRWSVGG